MKYSYLETRSRCVNMSFILSVKTGGWHYQVKFYCYSKSVIIFLSIFSGCWVISNFLIFVCIKIAKNMWDLHVTTWQQKLSSVLIKNFFKNMATFLKKRTKLATFETCPFFVVLVPVVSVTKNSHIKLANLRKQRMSWP